MSSSSSHGIYIPKGCNILLPAGGNKSATSDAVFCEHCEMWLNGPTSWLDHKIGKKHKKNVRKPPGSKPYRNSSDPFSATNGKDIQTPPATVLLIDQAAIYSDTVTQPCTTYGVNPTEIPWPTVLCQSIAAQAEVWQQGRIAESTVAYLSKSSSL